MVLSPAEEVRYGRHFVLPEVGREGQARLRSGRVALVGVGGLGSPAALYLAAAGVGTLGLIDFDRVDESNLQRQVLYGTSDVGVPKLEAAARRLADLNPEIALVSHPVRLSRSNALAILDGYDVVLDGSDNFATRYLVNDAGVLLGKPVVYGALSRFEGQVAVFWGARGPCYRCLFAEPPPPGLIENCAEAGVLGVLPGIVGALQAAEALKLVLNVGEPLIGRLLLFDALGMKFREVTLSKNPACPVCSEHPARRELIDYDRFCGTAPASEEEQMFGRPRVPEIDVQQLQTWRADGQPLQLIDVRTPDEHDKASIDGATLMPMRDLDDRLAELDPSVRTAVFCHMGGRSAKATQIMRSRGFADAWNLTGGIDAWSAEIDSGVPRYRL